MTDNQDTRQADARMDHMLRRAFPSRPQLGKGFEQKVMSQIGSTEVNRSRNFHRKLIMLFYWMAFGAVTGWVLSDMLPNGSGMSSLGLVVLALAMALVLTSGLFLARQTRLRISDLFLKTVF